MKIFFFYYYFHLSFYGYLFNNVETLKTKVEVYLLLSF